MKSIMKSPLSFALATAGVMTGSAHAISYACNPGEPMQACLARMAQEQSNNDTNNNSKNTNRSAPQRAPRGNTVSNETGYGNGNGTHGRGQCNWLSAVNYVEVSHRSGTRCGAGDSFELDVRNISNQRLKILVYLKDRDGRWLKEVDGTFDDGVAPGRTVNQYVCHSGGQYKVAAMTLNEFLANRCTYPDYSGY